MPRRSRALPELALLFPELASLPAPPGADPEEEKRRLFAAMTHFVTEQAARQPVLLVVEDLHWCDDLSLDLLLHLARRCRPVPLLVLVTFRREEPHPPLRRWLTQLDRERLAQECALGRLGRAGVAAMLQAMLETHQEVDADLVDALYAHSEGNPFFVEEILTSLLADGGLVCVEGTWKNAGGRAPVPRSVQEAVQQRLASLSADARRLVTLAAVAGRRFNVAVLREVMHCDEAHLLALGFLWTGHDYERAGGWFRRALGLAEELDDPLLRAHSLNRLGNGLLNTGHIPEALAAHEEALSKFESQADRQGQAQTLELLGLAHFFMGDTARAVKDFYGRAIELFRRLGEIFRAEAVLDVLETIMPREQQPGDFFERQVARVRGELALAEGKVPYALATAERLLASTPGDEPQPIPHLLVLKGEALLALGRLDEAALALEEARRGAQQRQAPSILWRIQRSLGQVYHALRQEEQAEREFAATRHVIHELATTLDDPAMRERFLHAALGWLPKEEPPLPRMAAKQAFGGLAPREREVAALVTRGKTSREIADLLVVSERTAEVHVSNILRKLGFSSRAQIAAWAVEVGLTKD